MKKICLLILCCFHWLFSNSQTTNQWGRLIPMSELHEDLDILKYQLENVHAGLYTYTSKDDMDAALLKIKQQVNRPMSDIEFYRLLAPFQQKIKNGHSMIIPSESWDMYKKELPLFPFDIYWTNGELYILRNLSKDESLIPGSIIETINGESAQKVFNDLVDNWTSDGDNRTYPTSHINLDFSDFYANVKGTPKAFYLEILRPDGELKKVSVDALLYDELEKISQTRYKHKRLPFYIQEDPNLLKLKINGATAVLEVPTFDSSSKGEDGKKYSKYYSDAFKKIKKANVQNLILDLRDNGGGDPKPQMALLTHLCNQPIILYKKVYAITKKLSNKELYEGNISWLNFKLGIALKKHGNVYELKNWVAKKFGISDKPTPPSQNVFTGKLYVLIDGGSFSATGEVAGMLKSYRKDIIFIGEETGGNPIQNTSGIMVFMNLPNSKIRVRQSLICFEANVDLTKNRHGIIPDYYVRNSIEDELSNRDAIMDFTLGLIKSGD